MLPAAIFLAFVQLADRPASAALGATRRHRPAVFAAQFELSHACWLLTYPLAGWLGLSARMPLTLAATLLGAAIAAVWPVNDPEVVEHSRAELDPDHLHLCIHHSDAYATLMPSSSMTCIGAGPPR